MRAPLTLLFICECHDTCLRFQDRVEREGCHLLLATNREQATRSLLFPRVVHAVIIRDSINLQDPAMASSLRLISPHVPILLITAEWPSDGTCPADFDALCHATILSRRVSRDIVRFVRRFIEVQFPIRAEGPQPGQSPFVVRKPTYLN